LLAPAPVASLILLIAAERGATRSAEFGVSASIAIGCAVLLPRLYIEFGVHRGWLSRPHLPRRKERALPLTIAAVSVLTAIALVHIAGGGQAIVESLAAMAFVLVIALGVTFVWKISLHVAAMAGAVIITSQLFGAACIVLVPLVVLVAWSRVELREHTLAQVGGGALVGVLGSAQPYLLRF
jgi:hypothetical protein